MEKDSGGDERRVQRRGRRGWQSSGLGFKILRITSAAVRWHPVFAIRGNTEPGDGVLRLIRILQRLRFSGDGSSVRSSFSTKSISRKRIAGRWHPIPVLASPANG